MEPTEAYFEDPSSVGVPPTSESDPYSEYYYDDEGWPICMACGAYAVDPEIESENNSTDTDSESETVDERDAYLGCFDGTSPQQLYE